MKDANVLLEPDALAEHMRQLNDDVGLVCGIPFCDQLDNFAAHVEAAIINGSHARMLYLASALGQGHGVGKIMLFRRTDFERAGGFTAIGHTVGEDNAMAKAMGRIGKRAVFSHRPVRQILGRRNFLDVYQRQMRWSVIRRKEEILSFLAEPICQALPAFIAAGLAALSQAVPALWWAGAGAVLYLSKDAYAAIESNLGVALKVPEPVRVDISWLYVLIALAVMAVAVVAKPDDKWGETPCAFVELKPGVQLTPDELMEFCKQHLAGFKVPRAIVFGELPKTSTGKIQKFELRKRAGSSDAINT